MLIHLKWVLHTWLNATFLHFWPNHHHQHMCWCCFLSPSPFLENSLPVSFMLLPLVCNLFMKDLSTLRNCICQNWPATQVDTSLWLHQTGYLAEAAFHCLTLQPHAQIYKHGTFNCNSGTPTTCIYSRYDISSLDADLGNWLIFFADVDSDVQIQTPKER